MARAKTFASHRVAKTESLHPACEHLLLHLLLQKQKEEEEGEKKKSVAESYYNSCGSSQNINNKKDARSKQQTKSSKRVTRSQYSKKNFYSVSLLNNNLNLKMVPYVINFKFY